MYYLYLGHNKKKMNTEYTVFYTGEEAAEALADQLITEISQSTSESYNIALAGGSTPNRLYSIIGQELDSYALFKKVNFFWGDERCVPPDSEESNFGTAKRNLFGWMKADLDRVYRIKGEEAPEQEAIRYSDLLKVKLPIVNGLPQFDLILLGLGEDGHTASIFPGQEDLLTCDRFVSKAVHPQSQQDRITLTGKVINNAKKIVFLATGKNKAPIIDSIFNEKNNFTKYPASFIKPLDGEVEWFIDEKAASLL